MKVQWLDQWHVGGAGEDPWGGGVFQGGQQAAQGALVGNGVGDFEVEFRGGRWVLSAGRGDQQGWAGPLEPPEQVLEDGLAMNFEVAFGQAHA